METQTTTSTKEKINSKLQEWKGQAEQLNHQLSLGIEETKNEFEIKKAELKKWLDKSREEFSDYKKYGEAKAKQIKSKLDSLEDQLALGKAESMEMLEEQKKKINSNIKDLKTTLSDLYDSSSEKAQKYYTEAENKLDHFNNQFELLKLKLKLGKDEAQEEWKEKKNEISERLSKLSQKIDTNKEKAYEKWDSFSKEMSEAWQHVRNAFTQN